MTAEQAMEQVWGILCPDCGPTDYEKIVEFVEFIRVNPHGAFAIAQIKAGASDDDMPQKTWRDKQPLL
jgi:hypothetical protein